MKWAKRLTLSGFTVLVMLAVMELLLRHWGLFHTYSEINRGEFISPYSEHKTDVFTKTPCDQYEYTCKEYNYTAVNNEFGLRDTAHEVIRNEKCRILLLGDSFVEGAGAPADSTWPYLLEQILEASADDSLEVVSGGVGGSDPVFYRHLYDRWLEAFGPDIVVAAVNQSDFEDYLIRGGEERFTEDGLQYRDPPISLPVYEHCQLYRAYVHLLEKRDGYFIAPSDRRELLRKCLNDYEELFTNWHDDLRDDGVSLVVVIYPVPGDFLYQERFGSPLYIAEMDSLFLRLSEEGVPCVNLTDCIYGALEGSGGMGAVYWPMDMHYNSTGYAMLADCLSGPLLASFDYP